jgi:hypothetical protein
VSTRCSLDDGKRQHKALEIQVLVRVSDCLSQPFDRLRCHFFGRSRDGMFHLKLNALLCRYDGYGRQSRVDEHTSSLE